MKIKNKFRLYSIIISAVYTLILFVITRFVSLPSLLEFILWAVPYCVAANKNFFVELYEEIKEKNFFSEYFLIIIATLGAFAIGEYLEAVLVMILFEVGEIFEEIAEKSSKKSIHSLLKLRPSYANINKNNNIVKVSPEKVCVGTEITVFPGEKVPIDGIIIGYDSSEFDLSALTGESLSKELHPGNEVLSGSVNLTNAVKIRTTKEFRDSTASKILELVENASEKKSKTERFITSFSKKYTPAVCAFAFVLAFIVPLFRVIFGDAAMWDEWIKRGLTFLVISCPCALLMSVPLGFFGGIGKASKNGILIKGSNYLEALSAVTYAVFDKTGTLTKGVFDVVDIIPYGNMSKNDVLYLAALAESGSNHPIAQSIKKAYAKEISAEKISNMETFSGYGVRASVNGHNIYAGNENLMKALEIEIENSNDDDNTVVHVALEKKYAGKIIIADSLKTNTSKTINELKERFISTIMLTGDKKSVAEKISNQLNLDAFRGELLPADKVTAVEALMNSKEEKQNLIFIGDGINDAPVLARADIGIAMGALGSDAAIEAADIVIMDDDPYKLITAMNISSRTIRIVKQNVIFSLAVKAICLILSALGITGMGLAVFADVGVMIIAVLNSFRTLE